ncbi:hypothetical protein CSOJ01_09751 [Colletotrichum sojae]|uniref:Uncharacterized protein n=1 Tax=Colletotrichum sojae TaxID=2175907 RepID=A0A8H6J253_9PEZI|nr:hypothetical protein CSOJ01_09751 [Colletotrichum sojae]
MKPPFLMYVKLMYFGYRAINPEVSVRSAIHAFNIVNAAMAAAIFLLFNAPLDLNNDPFHDIGIVYNVVEVNLAIISASALALRPTSNSMHESNASVGDDARSSSDFKAGGKPQPGKGDAGLISSLKHTVK